MNKIRYKIDVFSHSTIAGWFYSAEKADEQQYITFSSHGEPLHSVKANKHRQDLQDAGIGNGDHAFSVIFEPPLSDEELANMVIEVTDYDLVMTCSEQKELLAEISKKTVYLEVSDLLNFLKHEKRVTGIQRLVSQLCTSLIAENRQQQYKFCALLSESEQELVDLDKDLFKALLKAILGDLKGDSLLPYLNSLTESRNPIEPNKSDLILGTGASFSFSNYALVVKQLVNRTNISYGTILYDLIPYHSRNSLPPDLSVRFSLWLSEMARISDFVVSISEYTNNEFKQFVAESQIYNPVLTTQSIPLGSHPPKGVKKSIVSKRYFIHDEFCVFVSTIETRKNHATLIRAWKKIIANNPDTPQLVIVGKKGWGFDELPPIISSDELLESKVLLIHDASDADLDWLYQHCLFSVYPSLYEGWGLPVTESLSRGKFCVCSNTTSLPEAGGEFADYFDPTDVSDIAKTISKYLIDRTLLAEKEKKIRVEYKLRTWDDYAKDLDAWLEKICSKKTGSKPVASIKAGRLYYFTKNKRHEEDFFDFIANRADAYSLIDHGEWFVPEDSGRWLHGNVGALSFRLDGTTKKRSIRIYLKYWLAVNAETIDFAIYANKELIYTRNVSGPDVSGHRLARLEVIPDENRSVTLEFRRKKMKRNNVPEPRDLFICIIALAVARVTEERVEILEGLVL